MSELAKDSHVEVYSEGVWYNAILLDNPIDFPNAKLYVRYTTHKSSSIIEVDQEHIRPVPPKDLYEGVVLENGMMVEVEYREGWWTGLLIKKMDKYLVFFGNHTGILEFDSKLVRPHLHWTGSKWELDKNWSTALKRVVTPQVTPIAIKSVSLVTTSPDRTARLLRQKEPETEGNKSQEKNVEPMKNQNNLGNGSTRHKILEENSEDETRKRKREVNLISCLEETDETCTDSEAETNDTCQNVCVDGVRPLSAFIGNSSPGISSDQSLNVMYNVAVPSHVNETPTMDTLMVLPFAKKSSVWKKYETKEEYNLLPQNPHFIPLIDAKEDDRELLAIGLMVTYYELLEEVQDLQLDVSSSKLSSLRTYFAKLEKHGFDVEIPRTRVIKMMSLKDGLAKNVEEIKCLEKELEAQKSKRQKLEEEIMELKRKEAVAIEKKEETDKSLAELESNKETIYRKIEDMEIEFNAIVSAQW